MCEIETKCTVGMSDFGADTLPGFRLSNKMQTKIEFGPPDTWKNMEKEETYNFLFGIGYGRNKNTYNSPSVNLRWLGALFLVGSFCFLIFASSTLRKHIRQE